MPTAHLIHGYIGAGKTTFARRLEQELPAVRFSHDEWMTRLYGDDPPVDQFPDFHERVSKLIDAYWTRCVDLGLDVVLDLGFWSRHQRDETRAAAVALGASARLYRLECPDEEAWQRVATRNLNLEGNLRIVRNTFDILKSRFEPLGDDEARIEVR
jgi:predicted kinase